MVRTWRYCWYSLVLGVGACQTPTIMLLANRYARGAATTVFYHDPAAWYHYLLLAIHAVTIFNANIALVAMNTMLHILLTMAETELVVLREGLTDLFNQIYSDLDNGVMNQRSMNDYKLKIQMLRTDLRNWVRYHQKIDRWLKDMAKYLAFTSTSKLMLIGSYVCLCVFTLPIYMRNGGYVDLFYVLVYSLGNVPGFFYETRLIEEVHDASLSLCKEIYSPHLLYLPKDIVKTFILIEEKCSANPFRVMAFRIVPDNSKSFQSILQTAYNALSFLMQMNLEDK